MTKHVHILGICGTFMGGVALLARELGFAVSGSDAGAYAPMSTQLETAGIRLCEGYLAEHLQPAPDLVVVGNVLSRGNPAVEYLLNSRIPYISGPQWLAENLLRRRWVLAVAGTHGKTTTSALLAWILEQAGCDPGFLIGGVPANLGVSARLGDGDFFVIEADEYDTAFFDKRSKFVHYRPRTLCLNNLEFDHADIFADLEAIKTQFHHLLRTVPAAGLVISRAQDEALDDVLSRGCWSSHSRFSAAAGSTANWRAENVTADGSAFELVHKAERVPVRWACRGCHNLENALAAAAAAHHAGVPLAVIGEGLASFRGVKRRMELLAEVNGIRVYDDFAHHPTAIATTLEGLRAEVGEARILVMIEPRSQTMRMGRHRAALPAATATADQVFWYQPAGLDWDLRELVRESPVSMQLCSDVAQMVQTVVARVRPGDHVVIMSNGDFDGAHRQMIEELAGTGPSKA